MSSSMHVYDSWRPPARTTERVPLTRPPSTLPSSTPDQSPGHHWPSPVASTRVDLPPPGVWAPPNATLLMSLTIAPLRSAPPAWAPPALIASPWGPPVVTSSSATDAGLLAEAPERRTGRRRAAALAALAVAVAAIGAVTAITIAL